MKLRSRFATPDNDRKKRYSFNSVFLVCSVELIIRETAENSTGSFKTTF